MKRTTIILISTLVAVLMFAACSTLSNTPTEESTPAPEAVTVPQQEQELTEVYTNETYDYRVSYPSNYELDISQAPQNVIISLDEPNSWETVAIIVTDYKELGYMEYIEEPTAGQIDNFLALVVNSFIESLENEYDDLAIVTNTSKDSHARILEAIFTDEGYDFWILVYFQWHQNSVYKVYGQSMKENNNLRIVMDSLIFSPPPEGYSSWDEYHEEQQEQNGSEQLTPASTSSPELPEIEEGWIRLRIENVGSIDYPTDFLEVQSGDYKEFVGEGYEVLGLVKSDFTLQQVGLNELETSALEEYRRVTFTTVHLNPGEEVYKANERYTMSQLELAVFQNALLDQVEQENEIVKSMGLGEIKVIDPGSVEVVEVGGMFPIVCTYRRQLNDNPVVLVRTYLFWNYDRIHYLVFSYRVEDEEECRDIYDKILYSFRFE